MYQQQRQDAINTTGQVLSARGFTESGRAEWQQLAEQAGMANNGPYEVLGAWEGNGLAVVLEQNTAPDTPGGPMTIYPPTVVVERVSDGVRVSVAGGDEETLHFVLDDLTADDVEAPAPKRARAR